MKKGKITFLNNLPDWLRRTIAAVLIAALVGGGVYGILLLVRGSGGKVKVYPIMDFCTNYADDQAETQGLVKPDKMQSIYVSETQKITKYYVREGDAVKVGDPILSYDTTLTDLQLERARISVQKLEIALDEANANLVKVNNYRLYVPQPDPPSRMKISPFRTSNVMSRRITAPGYPASTCFSSMIVSSKAHLPPARIRSPTRSKWPPAARPSRQSRRSSRRRPKSPRRPRRPPPNACSCPPRSRSPRR